MAHSETMEAHPGAMDEHPEAAEAHLGTPRRLTSGVMGAHHRAVKAHLRAMDANPEVMEAYPRNQFEKKDAILNYSRKFCGVKI